MKEEQIATLKILEEVLEEVRREPLMVKAINFKSGVDNQQAGLSKPKEMA